MKLERIEEMVVAEHRRDVRLTLLGIGLVLLVSILALFLLSKIASAELVADYFQGIADFFNPENNENYLYYIIAVSSVLVFSLGWVGVRIYQLKTRLRLIETFFNELKQGVIASNISETVVHKIKIPLIKIRLDLCPVTFIEILLDGSSKRYKFPIQANLITELKTYLSGVDASEVKNHWEELCSQKSSEVINQTGDLKTDEEVNTFVEDNLLSDIQDLETSRKKGFSKMILFSVVSILVLLGWFYFQYQMQQGVQIDTNTILIGFVGISMLFGVFSLFLQRRHRNSPAPSAIDFTFKTKVFTQLISFINSDFKYIIHGHIALEEFLEMGFFEEKHYDLSGNDQIIGVHSGVPFQLCDLNVSRKRNFTDEKSAPDEVFYGQIFVAQFNKSFKNEVYIVPKKLESVFSRSDASLHLKNLGSSVKLENPEFMKLFNVYSNDQIEARYILSASMMTRLMDYQQKSNSRLMISFRNNRIFVANYSRKNNFELSIASSLMKNNKIQVFYRELKSQLEIIEDLKLNVNIWKT